MILNRINTTKYSNVLAMIIVSLIFASVEREGSGNIARAAAPTAAHVVAQAAAVPSGENKKTDVWKTISVGALEKYKTISITVKEKDNDVTYTGVPLRDLLADMVPDLKLDSMPEWKTLSRRELVMEIKGSDGFPALVTATDLAINKAGDRFVLATQKDGKKIEAGVHLICKMDEVRVRWIREVASLRVVSFPTAAQ